MKLCFDRQNYFIILFLLRFTKETHCKTFQLCRETKQTPCGKVTHIFTTPRNLVREFPHNYSSTSNILELPENHLVTEYIWQENINTENRTFHICNTIRQWVISITEHPNNASVYRSPLPQIKIGYFQELKCHLTAG